MNQIQREKGTEKRYDFSESFKSFLTRGGGVRTYGVGVSTYSYLSRTMKKSVHTSYSTIYLTVPTKVSENAGT